MKIMKMVSIQQLCFIIVTFSTILFSQTDSLKKEELRRRIHALLEKKKQEEINHPPLCREVVDSLRKIQIHNCEENVKMCDSTNDLSCADSIFKLANLYYEQHRYDFINSREVYENEMDKYDKDTSFPEPIEPKPDFSKAILMFRKLVTQYPDYSKNNESYYMLCVMFFAIKDYTIAIFFGDILRTRFPNSSQALKVFNVYNYLFESSDMLSFYEKVEEKYFDSQEWQYILYRKAELCLRANKKELAKKYFTEYLENCKKGICKKCSLINEVEDKLLQIK